jgi:hypothetical protein
MGVLVESQYEKKIKINKNLNGINERIFFMG